MSYRTHVFLALRRGSLGGGSSPPFSGFGIDFRAVQTHVSSTAFKPYEAACAFDKMVDNDDDDLDRLAKATALATSTDIGICTACSTNMSIAIVIVRCLRPASAIFGAR